MEVLRFTLSGKQGFFKKPDVNAYYYFTYGHIHKVALLGLFGAILGYGGYNSMKKEEEYPEFYDRLKNLNISVVPVCNKGCFDKKIIEFNNSVGYASKETGGNLIVKQQWLESPKWHIYLKLDSEESKKIADYIINNRCKYMPYLGSNDHPADITNVSIVQGQEERAPKCIGSMFLKKSVSYDLDDQEYTMYKYEEELPIGLDKNTHLYIFEKMMFSNMQITNDNIDNIYAVRDNYISDKAINIMFY